MRRVLVLLVLLVLVAFGALKGWRHYRIALETPPPPSERARMNREALFAEIHPVKLANCDFERIGDPHDGGYLICGNLLADAKALYSYGISGADEWGCALSRRLSLPVHQYDCFNTDRPPCPGAQPVFHAECVGSKKSVEDGRPFDTVPAQIAANGDAGKRVIMKMDVEGAEWPSFMATSDDVLDKIDQLSVEFHGVESDRQAEVMHKLAAHFYVVNVHDNNWTCEPAVAPFQSKAFEVLFVNKKLGVVDPNGTMVSPNPLDAPNNWMRPDCPPFPATGSKSPR